MYKPADIQAMRKARGMTQEQVGILAGMSKSQVSRMEKGKLGSPATYQRVLDALGYRAVLRFDDIRGNGPLNKDQLLSMLKVYYLCNKDELGIEKIGLFGSFARNEAGPESDIDIAVSLKTSSLMKYSVISRQLESVFNRRVDVISLKSHLTESFKQQINSEIIYVS